MRKLESGRHVEQNKKMLGRTVAVLRKQQRLTKPFFCLMASISRPTVNKIEAGSANATITTLTKVADALGVNVSELFSEPSDK